MPRLKRPDDKPNKSAAPVAAPDPRSGPWGRINTAPQSALTLRLCKGVSSSVEESFSYPYRNLSSWYWRRELDREELKIEAGPDLITVRGEGLIRLVDALDVGALEMIREIPEPGNSTGNSDAINIESLVIEKTEPAQG